MLSVMITSYNLAPYIAQAVESVLSQETDFDVELLIGDDGSTDGTVELLKAYEARYPERIRLFVRDERDDEDRVSRAAANRMRLLAQAKGEYACFLDGDDYYTDTGRLGRMVALLQRPENADCVMCATNVSMVWEDGRQERLSRAVSERKISFRGYWRSMFLQSDALLFRNMYAQHPPQGALAELFDDNEICFWLFTYGKMYYLPECSVAYRQLAGSSWEGFGEAKRHGVNLVGYALERRLRPGESDVCLGRCYKDLQWLYRHRGEWTKEELWPWPQQAEARGWEELSRIYSLGSDTATEKEVRGLLRRGRKQYLLGRAQRVLRKMIGRY